MRGHSGASVLTILIFGIAMSSPAVHAVVFDPGFGSGGATIISIPNSADYTGILHRLADGRIIVAGASSPIASNNLGLLAAFNSNGTVDATFAGGGVVQSAPIDVFYSLNSNAAGDIFAGGDGGPNHHQFAIQRLRSNGSLDLNYTTVDFGGSRDHPHSLALANDGSLVAAGTAALGAGGDQGDIAVARLTPTGLLNWSRTEDFEPAGFSSSFDTAVVAVIQPDGKILVGGGGGGITGNNAVGGFDLLRYNADGSRDASFGNNGLVHTPFVNPFEGPNIALIRDLRLLDDGKILATGRATRGTLMLVKYNPDGTLANEFGNGGIALAAADPHNIQFDNISAVEHRADGSTRVLWLSDSLLYEAIVGSAGQQLSLKTYALPHLPQGNFNFQEYGQALVLPDGDILAVGRAAPERYFGQPDWVYQTDLLIARFEGNLDQVPEPATILWVGVSLCLLARRKRLSPFLIQRFL